MERDTQRLPIQPLQLEDYFFAVGLPRLDDKLFIGGKELPVEEVGERPPVDREELGTGQDSELFCDTVLFDAGDLYHSSSNLELQRAKSRHYRILALCSSKLLELW